MKKKINKRVLIFVSVFAAVFVFAGFAVFYSVAHQKTGGELFSASLSGDLVPAGAPVVSSANGSSTINISKVFCLDKNKKVIKDITAKVKNKDNNWATIENNQYVRIIFEKALDNTNDITIFAKTANWQEGQPGSRIEAYPVYTDEIASSSARNDGKIAEFPEIKQGRSQQVFLTNLIQPTDTFDLKVVEIASLSARNDGSSNSSLRGGQQSDQAIPSVDIDWIIDPAGPGISLTTGIKVTAGAKIAAPVASWALSQTTCNAISGWYWYTTNGRSACWSKTLADSVSWNKGVSDDTRVTGSYTCTSLETYDLQTRMTAAAAGEWYKVVSNVNSRAITSADNGSTGWPYISALAIADCVDGTKDLVDCNKTTTCTDWSTTNTWLRTWAGVSGKSALPYLSTDAGTTQATNDYWDACTQSGSYDYPLCANSGNTFDLNRLVCDVANTNYSWVAACGFSGGGFWSTYARILGNISCSYQNSNSTSNTANVLTFRVVVRP